MRKKRSHLRLLTRPGTQEGRQLQKIDIEKIRESFVTLRTEYNSDSLEELGDSLEEHGQLQMIVVWQTEDGFYELILGSRRIRSARLKGHTEIGAVIIEEKTPAEMLIMALAENLHRTDLNPFEEAQAFLRLMKEYDLKLGQIATRINKPEAYVTGRVQLLSMPERVIALVSGKELPLGHIRALAKLPDGTSQVRLAELSVKNGLSVSDLRAQIKKELAEPTRQPRSKELTPLKVTSRVNQFLAFLKSIPLQMRLDSMNNEERTELARALQNVGDEAADIESMIQARSPSKTSIRPKVAELLARKDDYKNQGQEWTIRELQRITAIDRPTDGVLAKELGRSVSAIRSMRTKASIAV